MNFSSISWNDDRSFELAGSTFVVEQHLTEHSAVGEDVLRFYKPREMVERYAATFERWPAFQPTRIMELGIYHGEFVCKYMCIIIILLCFCAL